MPCRRHRLLLRSAGWSPGPNTRPIVLAPLQNHGDTAVALVRPAQAGARPPCGRSSSVPCLACRNGLISATLLFIFKRAANEQRAWWPEGPRQLPACERDSDRGCVPGEEAARALEEPAGWLGLCPRRSALPSEAPRVCVSDAVYRAPWKESLSSSVSSPSSPGAGLGR